MVIQKETIFKLLYIIQISCATTSISSPAKKEEKQTPHLTAQVEFLQTRSLLPESAREEKTNIPALDKNFEFHIPPIEKGSLQNGFRLIHIRNEKLPLITITIAFYAGSSLDPPDLPGLANFTGEMLKGGTKRKTSSEIAESLESLGSRLFVYTDYDSTTLTITCMKENLEEVLAVLTDVLLNPSFPEDEIEKLRKRELNRLKIEEKDPEWLAEKVFALLIYGTHPYSRYDTTSEALLKINKKDIQKFYSTYFVAANGIIVTSGDMKFDEIFASASKFLAKIPKGKKAKPVTKAIPVRNQMDIVVINRPESVETIFKIGAVATEWSNNKYLAIEISNTILGGSPSSRLFTRVREKESNAYHITSHIAKNLQKGIWSITGATRSDSTLSTIRSILEEIETIASKEINEKEINEAASYLSGKFAIETQTTRQLTALFSDSTICNLPDNYWNYYSGKLYSIKGEEIQNVTKEFLNKERLLIVLVGDAKEISKSLGKAFNYKVIEYSEKI